MFDIRDHGGVFGGAGIKSKYGWEQDDNIVWNPEYFQTPYTDNKNSAIKEPLILPGIHVFSISSNNSYLYIYNIEQRVSQAVNVAGRVEAIFVLKNGDIACYVSNTSGSNRYLKLLKRREDYSVLYTSPLITSASSGNSMHIDTFIEMEDRLIISINYESGVLHHLSKDDLALIKKHTVYTSGVYPARWSLVNGWLYCRRNEIIYKVDPLTNNVVTISLTGESRIYDNNVRNVFALYKNMFYVLRKTENTSYSTYKFSRYDMQGNYIDSVPINYDDVANNYTLSGTDSLVRQIDKFLIFGVGGSAQSGAYIVNLETLKIVKILGDPNTTVGSFGLSLDCLSDSSICVTDTSLSYPAIYYQLRTKNKR